MGSSTQKESVVLNKSMDRPSVVISEKAVVDDRMFTNFSSKCFGFPSERGKNVNNRKYVE